MNVTKQLRITGRVQGVGFRHALQREALAQGLAGWVRNRRDGSVEAMLQGDAAAVEAVCAWARHGPPAARVDRLEVQANAGEKRCTGFEQLPTA